MTTALGTSSDGESPRVQIIDLTGDSDDDNTRQAMDEDDLTETMSGARAIIDPNSATARVLSHSVAIVEPPVAVATLQRLVAEQDTSRTPAFRKSRDGTTQDMDTLNVRRLALHAHQWRALTAPIDAPSAVDQPHNDALTFATLVSAPGDDVPMLCVGADSNTLLTLEHVSPLVQSRAAAFESGDEYGFSDSYEFVVDATRIGAADAPRSRADLDHSYVVDGGEVDQRRTRALKRANNTLDSAARYQHTMAFSAGRYEIAPPVAALRSANIVQSEIDVRDTLDRFTNSLNSNNAMRSVLLAAAARYGIVDALRAGATPRLFTQMLIPLGAQGDASDATRFNIAYRAVLIRGKPRFLFRVLSTTLEQARADGAMRAATDTLVRATSQFGATLASADIGAELGGVGAQDSAPIDALSPSDVRSLTRLRVLVDYERLLLEVNDVVRTEVSGDEERDTPFIITGSVREYDMLDPLRSLLRGKCDDGNSRPESLDADDLQRTSAWLTARVLRVPASSEARIADLFPQPMYDAELDALSHDLGVARRRRTVVTSDVLRREGRQKKRARVPTTEARATERAQENASERRKELRERMQERQHAARSRAAGRAEALADIRRRRQEAAERTPFSDVAMFGTTLSKGRRRKRAGTFGDASDSDAQSDSLVEALDIGNAQDDTAELLVGVEPREGEDIEGEGGAGPEQLERELADEQYTNAGISTALRADIHTVGVLARNYSQPTIAVPLEWSATEALVRVHAIAILPRTDEARAKLWRTDWRMWRDILELALYAKLVPCIGPLFGNDAHETLQLSLELVAERVSRERTFAETNTTLFLAERRLEVVRTQSAIDKARARIRSILDTDVFPAALTQAGAAAETAYLEEIESIDAAVAASVRVELTKLRALEEQATDDDVPRDSLPSVLAVRVASPDTMRYIDTLSAERIVGEQLEPADRAAFAYVLASVAQRPVSAADIFSIVPLLIDDDQRPLAHFYPLVNTYGARDALVPLLDNRDDALDALERYASRVPAAQATLNAPDAPGIRPSRVGTTLATLYEQTRDSPHAASALANAVFPYLDSATHNRLVQVHLAPPEIGTLTARRRQFAQLRDAFNDFGKPDTSKIANAVARREGELRERARRVMEQRGSERLTAASAQAYVLEHSAVHTQVYDQTPRVTPDFQLLPNDDVAPIGVFEAVGTEVQLNQQRTMQLLLSDIALGGNRVQIASVRQRADNARKTPIAFFYACAPHVTALIVQRVAENDAARDPVRKLARDFHRAYVAAYDGERGVTRRDATLDDYATWRTTLDAFAAKLLTVVDGATVHFYEDVDDDGVSDSSYRAFVSTAAASLGDSVRPALMMVDGERTRADRLVTLPFSGLAALERASSVQRRALRAQLHQAWYRVSLELHFQRLGYQYAPFNSSRLAPLPTQLMTKRNEPLYGNVQTLHVALRAHLRAFTHRGEAIDSEGESASESGDDSSADEEVENERERDAGKSVAPYTEKTSAALELRTLLNRLETESTTLHVGRTLWFELAALHTSPHRYHSAVMQQIVVLWDTLRDGRRVAIIAPLSSTTAETGLGSSRPLPFDPRAESIVRDHWQPYAAAVALDRSGDEEREAAEDALREFLPVIDAVVDRSVTPLGGGIEFLVEAPTTIEEASAAAALRANLETVAQEGVDVTVSAEQQARIAQAIARARARELDVRVTGGDPRFNFGLDDTEALTLERGDIEAATRDALERRELVSEQYDVPLCSLKRVSADGIHLVQQLAGDARIRVARQRQLLEHFDSRDSMLKFLNAHRTALLRSAGEKAPAHSGKQRIIRDTPSAQKVLRVLLDDVLRALIDEHIALRRDAILSLAADSQSQHRDVSVELMRTAALSVLSEDKSDARFYNMPLAPVDVAALQVLLADLRAIELSAVAEQLEQSLGTTQVPTVVGGGAVRVMIDIPTLYVRLLASAAIERARIVLQQEIESGGLGDFHAQRTPYALAHRADAHQALRIDELVRRFALSGEIPLARDNDQYTPYGQYIAARSPEQRAGVAALGRLRAFGGRLESLREYAVAPRYVSFGEGEHRTHASGADVQLSALAVHLLCAYGAVHNYVDTTIASLYRKTQLNAPKVAEATRAIARHNTPLVRLWAHLVLFFGAPGAPMRAALAREFGIIGTPPSLSMPVLRAMRPVDLRLLVLVLLGFDTAARTDVSPDSRGDASSASPPLMPPAYTHMRTTASKLLLADAYYTALLESLYSGYHQPRLFVTRGADDNSFAVAIAEHDDEKHTGASPVRVLTREQHRALYRERLRDATLTEDGATRILHARFTRLVAEPLAVQVTSLSAPQGNARVRAFQTLAELAYVGLYAGDAPPIYDQPWLLIPRLALIGGIVRFATASSTVTAATRVRRTLIDTLERSLRLLDDAAHLIVRRAPIDGEALLRANVEASVDEEKRGAAETPAVMAVDEVPVVKAAIATDADEAAAVALPGSVPSLPQTSMVDVGEWLAVQRRLIAQLLALSEPVKFASTPRLISIGKQLLDYELDRLQPNRPLASSAPSASFFAALEPVLRSARFIFDRVLDSGDALRFETGRSAVERELTDAAISGSQSASVRALVGPQRELLRMLVVAETDRRILWRPKAEGSALQQATDRKNARNVELHADASSSRAPFYQSWSVLIFSALEQSFRGGASPNPKQIIQCFIDDASLGIDVPVAVQRMVRAARAYLTERGRRSVVPGELQRYVPLYDAIDCIFTRPPKRKKTTVADDDDEPAVRDPVDRYETPRTTEPHRLSQRHPLVPLLLAPLLDTFFLRILSQTITSGNKDVGLANGQLTLFGTKRDGTVIARNYASAYDPDAFATAIDSVRIGSANVLLVHEFTFAKAGGAKGMSKRATDSYTTISIVTLDQSDAQRTLRDVLNAARRQQYKLVSINHPVPVPNFQQTPWLSIAETAAAREASARRRAFNLTVSVPRPPPLGEPIDRSVPIPRPPPLEGTTRDPSTQQTTTASQVRPRGVRRRTRRRVAFAVAATPTNGANGHDDDDDDDDSSVSSSEPARMPIPDAVSAKYSREPPYVASVLISSERESLLVDAQMTPAGAARIGDWVYGKNVQTIWITHAHPDHVLGAARIISMLETRGTVRVLARPDVVDALNAQIEQLRARAALLGFTRPLRLPVAYTEATLRVGVRDVIIKRMSGDARNIDVLWLPWRRTLVASDLVFDHTHAYLVDADPNDVVAWRRSLAAANALRPRLVIPGHSQRKKYTFDRKLLDSQYRYLGRWQEAQRLGEFTQEVRTPEERAWRIVAFMEEKYLNYAGRDTLLESVGLLK